MGLKSFLHSYLKNRRAQRYENAMHLVLDAHHAWQKDNDYGTRLDMTGADLRSAIFTETELADSVFDEATFFRCSFKSAEFAAAKFYDADMQVCDFERANMSFATFKDAVMRKVKLNFQFHNAQKDQLVELAPYLNVLRVNVLELKAFLESDPLSVNNDRPRLDMIYLNIRATLNSCLVAIGGKNNG